jgi:hypothetical protein
LYSKHSQTAMPMKYHIRFERLASETQSINQLKRSYGQSLFPFT